MANIQLSRNLKYLRDAAGWTQDDISALLNMSRQAYSNYENMNRTPDLDTLTRFADLYRVSLDALVCQDLSGFAPAAPSGLICEDGGSRYSRVGVEGRDIIYLTKEEAEFISKFRTLSPENKQILRGFLDARALSD